MKNKTRDAADILSLTQSRFGSAERARVWVAEGQVPGFGSQTTSRLVHAGRGGEVLDYIAAVDAGIYS